MEQLSPSGYSKQNILLLFFGKPIAAIAEMEELNIGHAIIARAVFVGLPAAVAEMKRLMVEARNQK